MGPDFASSGTRSRQAKGKSSTSVSSNALSNASREESLKSRPPVKGSSEVSNDIANDGRSRLSGYHQSKRVSYRRYSHRSTLDPCPIGVTSLRSTLPVPCSPIDSRPRVRAKYGSTAVLTYRSESVTERDRRDLKIVFIDNVTWAARLDDLNPEPVPL